MTLKKKKIKNTKMYSKLLSSPNPDPLDTKYKTSSDSYRKPGNAYSLCARPVLPPRGRERETR